jgi:hypothetical protein
MAESFTTTNRFFDNKNYPRGFPVMVISPSKRRNCWNVMVMPLTNWNWVNANLSPKMKNSLFRYVVVNVSQQRKWNASGLSIWRVLSGLSVFIRCPAVNRRLKALKITPKAMIKKKGVSPFFTP